MIEIAIVTVAVVLAACYWYARLFPQGWQRVRATAGLAPRQDISVPQSKECNRCSGCKGGGCH